MRSVYTMALCDITLGQQAEKKNLFYILVGRMMNKSDLNAYLSIFFFFPFLNIDPSSSHLTQRDKSTVIQPRYDRSASSVRDIYFKGDFFNQGLIYKV